ncbi:MAG: nitrogenase component 1 [Paludibacteraceae bacterium]|nr:nitrogenase component 1 [Paludibacteraceae bacterium]
MNKSSEIKQNYTATRNACKLCAPLGASVVFKGIEGCVPMIHGSQGCATYIRRYMISHYKEPVDIASSNFSEETTVYGGAKNFIDGIDNVIRQYHPKVMGIASTCLAETIGEDVPALIREYQKAHEGEDLPYFAFASTPSYQGSHMDGFHETVLSVVKVLAETGKVGNHVNLFSGFISPADIRYLKDIFADFGLEGVIVPDYSDSLDNPYWKDYKLLPEGGTPLTDIKRSGSAMASIEFGSVFNRGSLYGKVKNPKKLHTAGTWLEETMSVPNTRITLPIGIGATDRFFELLSTYSGNPVPEKHAREKGRLIDAYVDGHKYVFGKRAIVFGEEDFVLGLVSFLLEIGIMPVLVASGGESGLLKEEVTRIIEESGTTLDVNPIIVNGMDFETINDMVEELKPDIMIGSSKGYYISRRLDIPLIRVGFPIHDRFGAQRLLHIGYKGTQELFDRIANALIEYKQEKSKVGYKYI